MSHDFEPYFGKNRYICKRNDFSECPGVYIRTSKELNTSFFLPFTAYLASLDVPLTKVMEFFDSQMTKQTYKDLKKIILGNLDDLPYTEEQKATCRELVSFAVWPGTSMKGPQAEVVKAIREVLLEDQNTCRDLRAFLNHIESIKRNFELQQLLMDMTVVQMDKEKRSAKRQKTASFEKKLDMKKPSEDPEMTTEDVDKFFASIQEDEDVPEIAGGVQGMPYSEALGKPFTDSVVCVYPPMRGTLGRASDSFVKHKIAVSPGFQLELPEVQNFLNDNIYRQKDVSSARKLLEQTKRFNAELRAAMNRMGISVPRRRKQKVKN